MHEKAECNIMVEFGEIYLTDHESKAEYSLSLPLIQAISFSFSMPGL